MISDTLVLSYRNVSPPLVTRTLKSSNSRGQLQEDEPVTSINKEITNYPSPTNPFPRGIASNCCEWLEPSDGNNTGKEEDSKFSNGQIRIRALRARASERIRFSKFVIPFASSRLCKQSCRLELFVPSF